MTVQQLSSSGRGAERAGGWVDPFGGVRFSWCSILPNGNLVFPNCLVFTPSLAFLLSDNYYHSFNLLSSFPLSSFISFPPRVHYRKYK